MAGTKRRQADEAEEPTPIAISTWGADDEDEPLTAAAWDAMVAEAEALEREFAPDAGVVRGMSDIRRRALGLPPHPLTAMARATAEKYGPAGWEAETRRLLDEFDNTTVALVKTKAASSLDVATRIFFRAERTGMPLGMAGWIARRVWRRTDVEIEGAGREFVAAMNRPAATYSPRRRGRPRTADGDWAAVVVAIERVIRTRVGESNLAHQLTTLVLLYFGERTIAMLRAGRAGQVLGSPLDPEWLHKRVKDTWREATGTPRSRRSRRDFSHRFVAR